MAVLHQVALITNHSLSSQEQITSPRPTRQSSCPESCSVFPANISTSSRSRCIETCTAPASFFCGSNNNITPEYPPQSPSHTTAVLPRQACPCLHLCSCLSYNSQTHLLCLSPTNSSTPGPFRTSSNTQPKQSLKSQQTPTCHTLKTLHTTRGPPKAPEPWLPPNPGFDPQSTNTHCSAAIRARQLSSPNRCP